MVQTFGDRANFHLHVHALVTRGGWTRSGEWVPVPYVDERAAEELLRHKVLALLRRRGLLSEERIELLLSWRRSGFSVHTLRLPDAGTMRVLCAFDFRKSSSIPIPWRVSSTSTTLYLSNVERVRCPLTFINDS